VKVTTTPKASRDLDEWIGRIAENNPLAAEAFQNRIQQCIEVIRSHPEAGRRHPKASYYRKLVEDLLRSFRGPRRDSSILAFSQKPNINSLSLAFAGAISGGLSTSRGRCLFMLLSPFGKWI
jgi:plasmid stabilization system protein ParE